MSYEHATELHSETQMKRNAMSVRRRLTTLREEKAQLWEQMRGISETAVSATRDLTPEEYKRYNRLEADFNVCQAEIRKLEGELGETSARSNPSHEARRPVGLDGNRAGVSDLTARALNAVESAERLPHDAAESLTRSLESDHDPQSRLARYVTAVSDEDYFQAFRKWMRDPVKGHVEWSDEERGAYSRVQDVRGVTIGTDTEGGFLLPVEVDPSILLTGTGSVDPMRALARVERTTQNQWNGVSSAGVTASWDAEEAEVSDDTPVLAQPSIDCHKGSAFVPLSIEAFEDTGYGDQIGLLFADAKAQLESAAFTTGSGSGQAKGIITAVAADAGSIVTEGIVSTLTLANVVANQNSLPARHRARAKWAANLSIINQARQLPAGDGLTTSLVDDSSNPPRMLGWDVHENSAIDGTIAGGTTSDYVLLSGDFSNYVIVDRVGATLEFIPHLFSASNLRPTGQRGFYLHWRAGGDAVNTDAFRLSNYSA